MRRTPFANICLLVTFLFNSVLTVPIVQAQELVLPKPGVMVHLSPPVNPPMLKGMKVNPNNPFRFEFILDKGDRVETTGRSSLQDESTRLIKYFLASLTIPEKDLWVNLSPYEKDRIVPDSFGLTEMGRDLLAQDYMLKQVTASLIYPEEEVGKKFWKRVYEEAAKKYGNTNIPVNTFNKVWIVPEKAVVYENAKAGTAYVVESKLKVMLEQDYLSLEKHSNALHSANPNETASIGANIVREIVIPELTKEINEGANFAQLRQVYSSLILATWYKKKIKDSILSKVYADKSKIRGIKIEDTQDKQKIYEQYLQAFKKGVYNYIKEDLDPATQERIPRKYFSGGWEATDLAMTVFKTISQVNDAQLVGDFAQITANIEIPKADAPKEVESTVMNNEAKLINDLAGSDNEQIDAALKEVSQMKDPDQIHQLIDDAFKMKGIAVQVDFPLSKESILAGVIKLNVKGVSTQIGFSVSDKTIYLDARLDSGLTRQRLGPMVYFWWATHPQIRRDLSGMEMATKGTSQAQIRALKKTNLFQLEDNDFNYYIGRFPAWKKDSAMTSRRDFLKRAGLTALAAMTTPQALLAQAKQSGLVSPNQITGFFSKKANPTTGLAISHVGDETPNQRFGSQTYDTSLRAIAQRGAAGRQMIQTYAKNNTKAASRNSPQTSDRTYQPSNGVLNNIRIENFDEAGWWNTWEFKVNAGDNAWIGLAAIHNYLATKEAGLLRFAKERADFILALQDADGGIRYGPKGQYHESGNKDFYWNIKSTENNESALAFLDNLFKVTKDTKYKQAADRIYAWLMKEMYSTDRKTFSRGMNNLEGAWKKDGDELFASDTAFWAPINRMLEDPSLGSRADRLKEVEAILQRAVDLTGVMEAGTLKGISFSPESRANGVISIEWSSQLAVRYWRMVQEFTKDKDAVKVKEYTKKYEELMSVLQGYFKTQDGFMVAPYAVYANGEVAANQPTGHGWLTPSATGSAASIYYVFALSKYDPLVIDQAMTTTSQQDQALITLINNEDAFSGIGRDSKIFSPQELKELLKTSGLEPAVYIGAGSSNTFPTWLTVMLILMKGSLKTALGALGQLNQEASDLIDYFMISLDPNNPTARPEAACGRLFRGLSTKFLDVLAGFAQGVPDQGDWQLAMSIQARRLAAVTLNFDDNMEKVFNARGMKRITAVHGEGEQAVVTIQAYENYDMATGKAVELNVANPPKRVRQRPVGEPETVALNRISDAQKEKLYYLYYGDKTPYLQVKQILDAKIPALLKVHGTAEDPRSLITDFQGIGRSFNRELRKVLIQILTKNLMISTGVSWNDPDMSGMINKTRGIINSFEYDANGQIPENTPQDIQEIVEDVEAVFGSREAFQEWRKGHRSRVVAQVRDPKPRKSLDQSVAPTNEDKTGKGARLQAKTAGEFVEAMGVTLSEPINAPSAPKDRNEAEFTDSVNVGARDFIASIDGRAQRVVYNVLQVAHDADPTGAFEIKQAADKSITLTKEQVYQRRSDAYEMLRKKGVLEEWQYHHLMALLGRGFVNYQEASVHFKEARQLLIQERDRDAADAFVRGLQQMSNTDKINFINNEENSLKFFRAWQRQQLIVRIHTELINWKYIDSSFGLGGDGNQLREERMRLSRFNNLFDSFKRDMDEESKDKAARKQMYMWLSTTSREEVLYNQILFELPLTKPSEREGFLQGRIGMLDLLQGQAGVDLNSALDMLTFMLVYLTDRGDLPNIERFKLSSRIEYLIGQLNLEPGNSQVRKYYAHKLYYLNLRAKNPAYRDEVVADSENILAKYFKTDDLKKLPEKTWWLYAMSFRRQIEWLKDGFRPGEHVRQSAAVIGEALDWIVDHEDEFTVRELKGAYFILWGGLDYQVFSGEGINKDHFENRLLKAARKINQAIEQKGTVILGSGAELVSVERKSFIIAFQRHLEALRTKTRFDYETADASYGLLIKESRGLAGEYETDEEVDLYAMNVALEYNVSLIRAQLNLQMSLLDAEHRMEYLQKAKTLLTSCIGNDAFKKLNDVRLNSKLDLLIEELAKNGNEYQLTNVARFDAAMTSMDLESYINDKKNNVFGTVRDVLERFSFFLQKNPSVRDTNTLLQVLDGIAAKRFYNKEGLKQKFINDESGPKGFRTVIRKHINNAFPYLGLYKAGSSSPQIIEATENLALSPEQEAILKRKNSLMWMNLSRQLKGLPPIEEDDNGQMILPLNDQAMSSDKEKGGIDFNADKINLQIQHAGEEIKFNIDPKMLVQLQNAPGFVPVIMRIEPLIDLRSFLGVTAQGQLPTAQGVV